MQVAYAIGVRDPVSVMVDTFGTGVVPNSVLEAAVRETFDLTPGGIIKALDLRKAIYSPTAAYGHFGRKPYKQGKLQFFPWELTDRVKELQAAVG